MHCVTLPVYSQSCDEVHTSRFCHLRGISLKPMGHKERCVYFSPWGQDPIQTRHIHTYFLTSLMDQLFFSDSLSVLQGIYAHPSVPTKALLPKVC